MKTINTLEELKKVAFAITKPTLVRWDQHNAEETLKPMVSQTLASLENCYDSNNSVITFVSESVQYVIPYTRVVAQILRNAGFINKSIYVPFSNWDYPVYEKERWVALWQSAKEQWELDFLDDCKKHSDKEGFGSITEDLLKKCFKIPKSGVYVKHLYWEQTYYPYVHTFDCMAIERLGRYCTNNGTCVFVYRNGNTYVTRDWDVVNALRKAGYKEGDLFVPFSNGEVIQDTATRMVWQNLTA